VQSYESIMRTMQSDMTIIKSKWEQRCREVEDEWKTKLKSDVDQLKRQYQTKIETLMQEYNRCAKEGTTMVVQAD
jgi:gas vesicle protein